MAHRCRLELTEQDVADDLNAVLVPPEEEEEVFPEGEVIADEEEIEPEEEEASDGEWK
jgi:hypothetical protein